MIYFIYKYLYVPRTQIEPYDPTESIYHSKRIVTLDHRVKGMPPDVMFDLAHTTCIKITVYHPPQTFKML